MPPASNSTLQRFCSMIWANFQRFTLETGLFGTPKITRRVVNAAAPAHNRSRSKGFRPAHSAVAAFATAQRTPLQSLADLSAAVAPPGAVVAPPGVAVADTAAVIAPPGGVIADTAAVVAPPGAVVADIAAVVAPPGAVIAPPGGVIVAPGAVVAPPGGAVADTAAVVAAPGGVATPPGAAGENRLKTVELSFPSGGNHHTSGVYAAKGAVICNTP
jgi:hypothetical protein